MANLPPNSDVKRWFAEQLHQCGQDRSFSPADVLQDLAALEEAFPPQQVYRAAIEEIWHQLQVIHDAAPGRDMAGRLGGWRRHAFQSSLNLRGGNADLRIVYRRNGSGIELLGFGHRHLLGDIYRRFRSRPLTP